MSIAGGSYFSRISCKLHLSQVRVPEMVIAGVQSAGKTTLIEGIIGFPVGYTKRAWVLYKVQGAMSAACCCVW